MYKLSVHVAADAVAKMISDHISRCCLSPGDRLTAGGNVERRRRR